jgi:peroxiredoxin
MRRWSLPFGFLVIALGAALYYQQLQARGRAGFPAPDFMLKDLEGQARRLSDFKGKIVFLNVWATWCPPCRMEMPSMEHLYRRLQDRDFAMVAVSEDENSKAAVRSFVEQLGLTFPVLLDPEGIVPGRYGVTGYPETFVIDRQGKVIQHTIGPEDWASEQAYQFFTRLLDASSGTTQASGGSASRGG